MYPYPSDSLYCPIDALPDLLYDAVCEVHALDDDIPAQALLTDVIAVSASVVHQCHDVRGLDKRVMPTTINTLAVIPTAVGKGSSYREFFQLLRKPVPEVSNANPHNSREVFHASFHRLPVQKADVGVAAGMDAYEDYGMQDISFRALMEILNGRHRSTTIQHEDGWGFLQSDLLARHPDKLSQFWSGVEMIRHKVHRVDLLALDARCSLGFRIQPELFDPYMQRTGGVSYHQGLWPRAFAAHYDPAQKLPFPAVSPTSRDGLACLGKRLRALLVQGAEHWNNGASERIFVELDDDAAAFMLELRFHMKAWLERDYADVRAAAGRAWENTLRLAAVFHVVCGNSERISRELAERAWTVVQWSLTQHRIILARAFPPKSAALCVTRNTATKKARASRPIENARALMDCIELVCSKHNQEWALLSEVEPLTGLPSRTLTAAWKWLVLKELVVFHGIGARASVSVNRYSNRGTL